MLFVEFNILILLKTAPRHAGKQKKNLKLQYQIVSLQAT